MPRYDSLRTVLSGILRHFLTLDTSVEAATTHDSGGGEGEEDGEVKRPSPLETRMAKLEQYIEQLPRNVEDRQKLVEHGYSETLWNKVSPAISLPAAG